MKVEEGKFYKTRAGLKAGPMKLDKNGCSARSENPYVVVYSETGLANSTSGPPHQFDLLSEWIEGPVRTETVTTVKKVILSGTYGIVSVRMDPLPNIAVVRDVHTASDLREAAATFIAIAEALEANK